MGKSMRLARACVEQLWPWRLSLQASADGQLKQAVGGASHSADLSHG